jgi:RHS repeat-associated protein
MKRHFCSKSLIPAITVAVCIPLLFYCRRAEQNDKADAINYEWQADTSGKTISKNTSHSEIRAQNKGTAAPIYKYNIVIPGRTTLSAEFRQGIQDSISLGGVTLTVPAGGMSQTKTLSITGLPGDDLPPLPAEITNVTNNYFEGYRFLPHGIIFNSSATIAMAYDNSLIPEGYSADDIYTFYFDEKNNKWEALERDSIDYKSSLIVSRTLHFTDMINGIIKIPESPETEGFVPTSINDIKAADPAAGITIISPPAANNTGDAELSFPLKLPEGRSGVQPRISLGYSSDGTSGWAGYGWDLSVSGISVDITWGVPRYLADKESETYLFSGSQLTPVAHRGEYADRTAEKRFYQRIEGSFSKIIRHGDNPKNYWWEVTTKDGVRNFYGGLPGTGIIPAAVASDVNGNIGSWSLTETRDLHDNFVTFLYEKPPEYGQKIYISEIIYTGHSSEQGPYKIKFLRSDDSNTFERKDGRINANSGYIQRDLDLLRRVIITYNNDPVRSYTLQYREGVFARTLLESITELDASGNEFYKHRFGYYDDTHVNNSFIPFGSAVKWTLPDDNLKNPFLNPVNLFFDNVSSLGGSGSSGGAGGVAATVGLLDGKPFLKSLTAGGNVSYQSSESEGFLSLTDLNGDGLPDKVYKKNNRIYYRPNLLAYPSEEMFGTERLVEGIDKFSISKTTGFAWGVEAHPVIFLGYNNISSKTKNSVYFADFNADGLVDLVNNGVVYFNHLNENGDPVFTASSELTPNPLSANSQIDLSVLPDPAAEQAILEERFPLHDAVKMWQALYTGTISLNAPVRLIEDTSIIARDDKLKDGVKVSIQHNGTVLWSTEIDADDYNSKTPGTGLVPITRGDRIYFRVQSRFNGSYDKVYWDPEILYHSINGSDTLAMLENSNSKKIGRYKASEDFILCGQQSIGMPKTGAIRIRTTFDKSPSSDSVKLEIIHTDTVGNQTIIFDRIYGPSQAIVNDTINLNREVLRDEFIRFRVTSSTNIDWSKIKWDIYAEYSRIDDGTPLTTSDGIPLLSFKAIPEFFRMFNNSVRYEYPVIADTAFLLSAGLDSIDNLIHPVKVSPLLAFNNTQGPVLNDVSILSVKSQNRLFEEKKYQFDGIMFGDEDTLTANIRLGDTLYFEYHFSDFALAESNTSAEVIIGRDTLNPYKASVLSTIMPENEIFGQLFRGWGQFDYNGNAGRATSPIDESLLRLSDIRNTNVADMQDTSDLNGVQNPLGEVFNIMIPYAVKNAFIGTDEQVYVLSDQISSSRSGEKNVYVEPIVFTESGLNAISKETHTSSNSVAVGGSVGPLGASYSHSWGEGNLVTDMMDMNGDRYPDLLSTDKIQYTGTNGVLSGAAIEHFIGDHSSESEADGFTLGGSFVFAQSNNSLTKTPSQSSKTKSGDNSSLNNNAKSAQETSKSSIGLSGNFSTNSDFTDQTWLDINGDGLPDKIYQNGSVRLNLGYSFAPPEQWNFNAICVGESQDFGGGLGVNIKNGSIVAGVGISKTVNEANETFMDINADGLQDMVKGNNVYFNMGSGFAPPVVWTGLGALDAGESIGESANAGFTIGIAIPIFLIKICINPSMSVSRGISSTLTQLADINGDGMPDFLSSEAESEMFVKSSNIFRTNVLKTVENPLGGSFELDYLLTPAVYDHPGGKLAMKSVKVFDGLSGDGIDTSYTSFEYEAGYYDRHERQFYGFGTVKTHAHDNGNGNIIYRTVKQQFSNSDYYKKGSLLAETISDSEDRNQKGSENIYSLREIHTGAPLPESSEKSDRTPAFVALEETRHYTYNGKPVSAITTRETYAYDTLGNISEYTDYSSGNENDKYSVAIEYHSNSDNYIYSVASRQEITTLEGLKRKNETSVNEFGNITQIRQSITGTTTAQFDMEYDEYGNLKKLTRPANHKGERLWYEYEYDPSVHSFVTGTTDAYGYTNSTEYDYKWGLPVAVTDRNNQKMLYTPDDCGRIKTITGPYELASGRPYTIAFDYHPDAEVPYAHTMHYDSAYNSNIETYSFTDGLGRPVQVKKTALLCEDPAREDTPGFIVSGMIAYDAFHRAVATYQPVFEPATNPSTYNKNPDNIQATITSYDVLDRIKRITLPDGSYNTHTYNTGDYSGETMFTDSLTDALNHVSVTYTKADGHQAATVKVSGAGDIITGFDYNALGELLTITDPKGNKTNSVFNMAGKQVSVKHPDSGLTEFTYDNAGNLVKKITANLRKQIPDGGAITYKYDHERLIEIVYPRNVQNRVNYRYGAPGAPFNRAGRVEVMEDASGGQEYFYSPLGQTIKTIRTMQLGESDLRTWIWSATYDTWNRIQTMTYPDGEKVFYKYNRAGNLIKMDGEKLGRSYAYISRIGYNKYEKLVYQQFGNGTISTHSFEPKRQRLVQMSVTSAGKPVIENTYKYDAMNNILGITNNATATGDIGGSVSQIYSYDELYHLTSSSGRFTGKNDTSRYSLAMQYDIMGKILQKTQTHNKNGSEQTGTTYDFMYKYESPLPNAATQIGERVYTYDENGNPTSWQDTVTNDFRQLAWDEENRLTMISDNGYLNRYVYDASGERALKSHGGTQGVYVNGAPVGIINHSAGNYTVYVSPYFVFQNNKFTKHYYSGDTRVVSKIGNGQFENQYRPGVFGITAGGVNYINRQQQLTEAKESYEKQLGTPPGPPTLKGIYADPVFTGTAFPDPGTTGSTAPRGWPQQPIFAPAGGPPGAPIKWGDNVTNENVVAGFGFNGTGHFEEDLRYFYHSDHLGSTSHITDAKGDVSQFISYIPFGETFVEQHSDWDSPYKFNAKEIDNETGLYYYGARYYDPRVSIWLGVDPMGEKYPSLSPYVYTADNPVLYIDPDGREIRVTGWFNSTITVTGRLVNTSSTQFTAQEMADYARRLKTSIEATYQHRGFLGRFFKFRTVANISVGSAGTPHDTDHEFRIVDQGKIPGLEGNPSVSDAERMGTVGQANKFGGKIIYFSTHLFTNPPAGRTLERSGPHELGHSARLEHPKQGTLPGNIMHQSRRKEAGTKITWYQLLKIKVNAKLGRLNK